MALLIYDNGALVKNISSAQFPPRSVDPTTPGAAAGVVQQSTTQNAPLTYPKPTAEKAPHPPSHGGASRLYAETGRKSDSLQDRRRLTALHVMSTPAISMGPFDTIRSAWQKMQHERINHLVISNNQGHPLGVVSANDLLRYGIESERFIENLLTSDLLAVSPDTLVREIALTFTEKDISAMPVVSQEHQVIGIICRNDLLRLLVSGPNLAHKA